MLILFIVMFLTSVSLCYAESVRVMYIYTPYARILGVSTGYASLVTMVACLLVYG